MCAVKKKEHRNRSAAVEGNQESISKLKKKKKRQLLELPADDFLSFFIC